MEQTPHITELLAALVDNQMPPGERDAAASHLAECDACRAALEDHRFAADALSTLPLVSAPDSIWLSIEESLQTSKTIPFSRRPSARWILSLAASLVVVCASLGWWWSARQQAATWNIMGRSITEAKAGDLVETGSAQRATVTLSTLGFLSMAPDTRLRMVSASASQHRLSLLSGRIHVEVTAPPRLFQVETAAGIAVDLGCKYDLVCDRQGNGYLRVTQGWVSYETDGRESLVPAGASCHTTAGQPPGVPVFDDAPAALTEAMARWDRGAGTLDAILASARSRDTLTLWHMLSRVSDSGERIRIFDRMASFTPLPPGLSRDRVLALDRTALRQWREELAWTW